MWNPFKKNTSNNNDDDSKNPNKMGFVQRIAMKKMMNMSDKERMKLMQKVMTPENIAKNKDKILKTMEQMRASGQMTADQVEMAKQKLGLQFYQKENEMREFLVTRAYPKPSELCRVEVIEKGKGEKVLALSLLENCRVLVVEKNGEVPHDVMRKAFNLL